MMKLIFGLAFVSMVFGKSYPGYESLGSDKFFISKDKVIFGQALAACKINGWTLARETKPEDTKRLNELIVNSKRTAKDYWLGGYLFGHDGSPLWIWYDGGAVIEYMNWFEGTKPMDSRTCMVKTTEGDVSGKWKAAACLEEHNYICEI